MKDFQPSGKCGNCDQFKHSIKQDNIVIEKADCQKGNDPKKCPPEDFKPRTKKKTKRPRKSWQIETYKSRKMEKKFGSR